MKIAIIGANGQLGRSLVSCDKAKCHSIYSLTHDDIEISEYSSIVKALNHIEPDLIINTAAYHSDMKNCYDNMKVNAKGVYQLCLYCELTRSQLVHISTDYVFDGKKKKPYLENDTLNPINYYGYSKYYGETIISFSNHFKYYIVRTSSLFGHGGSRAKNNTNFVEFVISKINKNEDLYMHDNVIMSPSYAPDVSKQIFEIIESELDHKIYHVSNSGQCSWFQFAEFIYKQYKNDDSSNIFVSKNNDSLRPEFTVLETSWKSDLLAMPNWQDAIVRYLNESD